MHEMALAEGVREIVDQAARAHHARRVGVVRVQVGALAQVEAAALRFAFDVVKRGSLADAARLEIVPSDGSAWCLGCSQPVPLRHRGDACPHCGSHQLQVTGGEELRVLDIEIDSAGDEPCA
ncbi:MAG TPA: hydrogenase maturation nickel metallochaperone HypA [Burkholderiaceae bacterium]|jgi:hydrogenase nickel incorporation protein HypA/HybF|nr:hydrogenase maturation nickel metallochaperone HypA [Burkholderiaceae bacterium]